MGARAWVGSLLPLAWCRSVQIRQTVRRADGFYFFTATTPPKAVLKLTSFSFSFSGFQSWFPRFVAAARAQVRALQSKRVKGGRRWVTGTREEVRQLSEGGGGRFSFRFVACCRQPGMAAWHSRQVTG